jgi:DNA-binding Lrp family transcriptional regulator
MIIGKPSTRALESFRMVPDRLWADPTIKDFDIRLYCCLCFNARGRDHCFETDATIARKLGVSAKTVQRGLQSLEQGKFIVREMVGRERRLHLRPEGNGQPVEGFELKLA